MTNIINLDMATAKYMTDLKQTIRLYDRRNTNGKYDEAISFDKRLYRNGILSIIGHNAEASEEAIAA